MPFVPEPQMTPSERFLLEAEIAREQEIIERQADQLAAMRHSSTPSRLVRVVWTRMH